MASSSKKVILRTRAGVLRPGYLPVSGFLEAEAGDSVVPLLDLEGRVTPILLTDVLWIAYVRDFNLTDQEDPERLIRRTFLARPRSEGLWVRMTVAGEILEGLAPIDISLADGLLDDKGIFIVPPDTRSNTQRLYLPRTAISQLQVVAVITTPSKAKSNTDIPQPTLFPESSRR